MVSIHSHLAEGRVALFIRALRILNLNRNFNPLILIFPGSLRSR
jgi:hypothetical protein